MEILFQAISGYDDGLDPRQRADIPKVDYSKKVHIGIIKTILP